MNLIIKYLRKNIGIQNYSQSIHNFFGWYGKTGSSGQLLYGYCCFRLPKTLGVAVSFTFDIIQQWVLAKLTVQGDSIVFIEYYYYSILPVLV